MNWFEKLGLVESVEVEPEYSLEDYASTATNNDAEVNVPENNVTDGFISEVYDANNLSDKSESVYKVSDLMGTLPPETPKKVVKQVVNNLLKTLGISHEAIYEDANNRVEIISSVKSNLIEQNNKKIKEYEADIENAKEKISYLTNEIAHMSAENEKIEDIVNSEFEKIRYLLDVIKDEVIENAAK